jgi:hypothetical protein
MSKMMASSNDRFLDDDREGCMENPFSPPGGERGFFIVPEKVETARLQQEHCDCLDNPESRARHGLSAEAAVASGNKNNNHNAEGRLGGLNGGWKSSNYPASNSHLSSSPCLKISLIKSTGAIKGPCFIRDTHRARGNTIQCNGYQTWTGACRWATKKNKTRHTLMCLSTHLYIPLFDLAVLIMLDKVKIDFSDFFPFIFLP